MQTMNFQCGHCNNLMAVSTEFLGQQVRCPHCSGVVVAPNAPTPQAMEPMRSPAWSGGVDGSSTRPGNTPGVDTARTTPAPEVPRAPEPPKFDTKNTYNSEDIFSEPDETADPLFASDPGQRIELPRPTEQTIAYDQPIRNDATAVVPSNAVTDAAPPQAPPTPQTGWSPYMNAVTTPDVRMPDVVPPESESGPIGGEVKRTKPAPKVDWFFPLVIFPLVFYALGITAVAVFLYMRLTAVPPSLFDRMPDVDGDNPGVRKDKLSLNFKKADALAVLPDHLQVRLKETLLIGDLEVTPLRVERKKIGVFVEGAEEAQPCENDSLVLHLRLKNVSKEYRFHPIDNYYDRHWDGRAGSAPLTVLVAGNEQFFGGPAKWYPVTRDRRRGDRREWIEGRTNIDAKGIGPGESMETVTATDGENKRCAAVLFGVRPYRGKLMWRLHLRRGLVDYKGRSLPAACVVGVVIDSKDYQGG